MNRGNDSVSIVEQSALEYIFLDMQATLLGLRPSGGGGERLDKCVN